MAGLNIPDEANPFAVHWYDERGHEAFELEGVRLIVAAELGRLLDAALPDEDSDYHYGCERLLELVRARASELRGEES